MLARNEFKISKQPRKISGTPYNRVGFRPRRIARDRQLINMPGKSQFIPGSIVAKLAIRDNVKITRSAFLAMLLDEFAKMITAERVARS